jgi:hypothetical protein
VSAAHLEFAHIWSAEILAAPPLIAPARQFVYPQIVPGEEEAIARGALQMMVRVPGGDFLATCALGFDSTAMPTGIWSCPDPDELCAVAGGYAYCIRASDPARSVFLPLRPVVEVRAVVESELLLFAGFHSLLAWGRDGLLWQTARLSWEGLRITEIADGKVHGFGWDLQSDKDVAFAVDLATGHHTGGAFAPAR